MILTTLSDYAKQKGISRARAYQLQSKLPTIDLPVNVTVTYEGRTYQVEAHSGTKVQTFVKQHRATLEAELARLQERYRVCATREVYRLGDMIRAIENNLK